MGIFKTNRRIESHIWNTEGKIQDKEYLEMFDQGLCLSMHQPYASLLVVGIKTWVIYIKIIYIYIKYNPNNKPNILILLVMKVEVGIRHIEEDYG